MNRKYSLYKIDLDTGKETFVLEDSLESIFKNYVPLIDPDNILRKNLLGKYLAEIGKQSEFNIFIVDRELNKLKKIGIIRL